MKISLQILLLLFTGISSSLAQVQKETIKDYLIPQGNYNKSTFYGIYDTNPKYRTNRAIYYVPHEQNYQIIDAQLFDENPTAIQTILVSISNTEVRMLKSLLTNPFVKDEAKSYSVPIVLLKLPINNIPVKWISRNVAGDVETCIATLTTKEYKDVTYKAIKVVKTSYGSKIQTIEYYLKGIGLSEVSFFDPSNGDKQIENRLMMLSFER